MQIGYLNWHLFVGNGFMTSQCCGYLVALTGVANGYDCVMIPGATKKAAGKTLLADGGAYGFCGGELATINDNAAAATVCSKCQCSINCRSTQTRYLLH